MFSILEKKIKIILMVIIIMGTLITSLTVNLTIRKNISDHSVQLSQQHIKQQNQNLRLNMNLIEETSRLVSENQVIKESLQTTHFNDKVIPLLDNLRASNLNILGVTVYGKNGALYFTSNTFDVPKFDKIRPTLQPPENLSGGNSFWLVRLNDIPSFNYFSVSKTGIFTCVVYIKDSQEDLLGYVFIDTDIKSIFDFYKPDDSGMFYNNSSVYIMTSEQKNISSPYNTSQGTDVKTLSAGMAAVSDDKSYTFGKNGKSITTYNPIPNSTDVVAVFTPLNINGQLQTMITVLLVLGFSFVLVSFLVIRILSKSIIYPLTRLYESMQK